MSELRDVRLTAFSTAAGGWRKASNQARTDREFVDREMSAKLAEAEGESKAEAVRALQRLSRNYQYIHVQCGLVHTTLRSLAEDLAKPQRRLKRLLEEAAEARLSVHDDGRVSYPAGVGPDGEQVPGGTAGPTGGQPTRAGTLSATDEVMMQKQAARGVLNPRAALAGRISADIHRTLREAAQVDRQHSATLAKLTTERGLKVSAAMWSDSKADRKAVHGIASDNFEKSDIPKGKTPTENARWWDGLSAAERDAYVTLYPASVGALDGIPADVRDTANRVVFREEHANTTAALARHMANEPPRSSQWGSRKEGTTYVSEEWKRWDAERSRLERAVKGMSDIDRRFAQSGVEGVPGAYLLGFSTEGVGRAIIANGNPDTAARTAVYVPGTTTNLGTVDSDLERMTNLYRAAKSLDGKQKLSTIMWFGYDAPQSIIDDAPLSRYANKGAPAYAKFLDGLEAANRTENGGHRIAVGHSYGTTLIGAAARQGGLNAGDVIFVGSPGVQGKTADELRLPKGHVWNQTADGDSVPAVGKFGHGKGDWGVRIDPRLGIPQWHPGEVKLPQTPSSPGFGAHQMTTDTSGHTDYWDADTQSLKNQAAVVAGEYDEVRRERQGR
ncbi:hypothetical protein GL263_15625 [Streptomyces durbertensis]|uniref:DUF1023 domain-containing protein n=1 Tax=Streptomyces durbertensis TaxID=2448886 RepID=A0ABR6EI18_9ACTN|nr:alpha/beta hydrolase [Streptomyces durbertensis]MBB1244986.1 hypothetical protein [Streptomyces durbertensis]